MIVSGGNFAIDLVVRSFKANWEFSKPAFDSCFGREVEELGDLQICPLEPVVV